MKPTKHWEKVEIEMSGGGELVQGTLYTCKELPQRSPLVLLMHDNSNTKHKFFKKNRKYNLGYFGNTVFSNKERFLYLN
jgi:hypothetical protein